MTLVMATAFLVLGGGASTEPLTVCEVLSSLTELNGKKIVARGVWEQGDAIWDTTTLLVQATDSGRHTVLSTDR
jgi:hypothetical protein